MNVGQIARLSDAVVTCILIRAKALRYIQPDFIGFRE